MYVTRDMQDERGDERDDEPDVDSGAEQARDRRRGWKGMLAGQPRLVGSFHGAVDHIVHEQDAT